MTFDQRLNIALADCLAYRRLSKSLADMRLRNPSLGFRLWEPSLTMLHHGLIAGEFDVGLCQSSRAPDGIEVRALWQDTLVLAASRQHLLQGRRSIGLAESASYPWITLDRAAYPGYCEQLGLLQQGRNVEPSRNIAAQSVDLMMTLVAAGYGVGLIPISRVDRYRAFGVDWCDLEDPSLVLTTYLLRRSGKGSDVLEQFVESLQAAR